MSITGQNIADEARGDLNDGDAANYRWSDAEILRFINAAIAAIIALKPEAGTIEDTMSPVPGSRQDLPSDGVQFLDVCNVIIDGADIMRGQTITEVERDAFNSAFPDWTWTFIIPDEDDPTNWLAHHFTHDPRQPTSFDVYPPVPDDDQALLVKYVSIPDQLVALTELFPLTRKYRNAAVMYTKFRMLGKDGRQQASPSIRLEIWNSFLRELGLDIESAKRVDPATHRAPGDDHG